MVITSDRGHLEQSQLWAWGWHLTPFSCNVVVWTSRPRVRPVQRVGVWSVHPCQIPTGEPSVSAGGLLAVANMLLCWGSQHTTHMTRDDIIQRIADSEGVRTWDVRRQLTVGKEHTFPLTIGARTFQTKDEYIQALNDYLV